MIFHQIIFKMLLFRTFITRAKTKFSRWWLTIKHLQLTCRLSKSRNLRCLTLLRIHQLLWLKVKGLFSILISSLFRERSLLTNRTWTTHVKCSSALLTRVMMFQVMDLLLRCNQKIVQFQGSKYSLVMFKPSLRFSESIWQSKLNNLQQGWVVLTTCHRILSWFQWGFQNLQCVYVEWENYMIMPFSPCGLCSSFLA